MRKKIIISIAVTVLTALAILGGIIIYRNNKRNRNPVKVYSVSNFIEYMGWNSESMDGSVTYEDEQDITVNPEQTVEEVFVKAGQKVKVGDPIIKFDMTIYQLKINTTRASINLNNAKIEAANRKLTKLRNMKPVERSDEEQEETTETTEETEPEQDIFWVSVDPANPYKAYYLYNTDGTKYEGEFPVKAGGKTWKLIDPGKPEKGCLPYNPDDTLASPLDATPDYNDGSGDVPADDTEFEESYTKEELTSMIREQEDNIRDLKLSNQTLALQIKKYEKNIEGGTVLAKMDGVVETADVSEEVIASGEPVIRIKGEGQSTASVNLSEWNLDKVSVGDEVFVMCYDDGMTYAGKVVEISLSPASDSDGSQARSVYPMTVVITDENEMDEYSWVQVSLSEENINDDESGTIALPLFMVKEENGNYFVMKETDGVLEKKYVKTGKIYWGTQIEIKSGLTEADYIAFPYSKDAVPDRKTKEMEGTEGLY